MFSRGLLWSPQLPTFMARLILLLLPSETNKVRLGTSFLTSFPKSTIIYFETLRNKTERNILCVHMWSLCTSASAAFIAPLAASLARSWQLEMVTACLLTMFALRKASWWQCLEETDMAQTGQAWNLKPLYDVRRACASLAALTACSVLLIVATCWCYIDIFWTTSRYKHLHKQTWRDLNFNGL